MIHIHHKLFRLIIGLAIPLILLSGCAAPHTITEVKKEEAKMFWPPLPASSSVRYVQSIKGPGDISAKKSFFERVTGFLLGKAAEAVIKPYGVTVDGSGRIIVTDTGLRKVHIFDIKKQRYFQIPRHPADFLVSPIGVAVDRMDNIYITDSVRKKILIYTIDGRPLREIEGDFERPTGIAINKKEGLLYVVDTLGHQVKVFDLKGDIKGVIGERGSENGKFNFPTNIFIDNEGFIYVTDSMNFRVQIFNSEGDFISRFGRHGDGSGDFAHPKGIGVDSKGHIYIVDSLFDAVQIFDRKGRFLLSFGRTGRGIGMFWLPTGLFIDSEDRIYVADSYNKRVQVFQFIEGEKG